jgi:hypothetical protein
MRCLEQFYGDPFAVGNILARYALFSFFAPLAIAAPTCPATRAL